MAKSISTTIFFCTSMIVLFGLIHTGVAGRRALSSRGFIRPRRQMRGYFAPPNDGRDGWSTWGQWSPCSRSCGGGTAVQTRTCYRGRYGIRSRSSQPVCPGPYKRYVSCNSYPCPGIATDIRAALCSTHDTKRYSGQSYVWEPFNTGNYCQLNCRARGHRFYVRHSTKETDGISCLPVPAPPATPYPQRHICVNGRCHKLGCDNKVNSGMVIDKCGVCGGNGASCEVVEGLFRRETLKLGYNFVVRIPVGATRINVTELSKSINYIALNSSNPHGRNYINGEWGRLDPSQKYQLPGTYVDYKRPLQTNEGESMIIPGPTTEDMDVWLFFQRNNPGIHYEYTIPKTRSDELDGPSPPSQNLQPRLHTDGRNLLDIGRHNGRIDGHDRYPTQPRNPAIGGSLYPGQPRYISGPSGRKSPVRPSFMSPRIKQTPVSDTAPQNSHRGTKANARPPVQTHGAVNRVSPIEPDLRTPQISRELANPRREVKIVKAPREDEEGEPRVADTRGNQAVETVVQYLPGDVPGQGERVNNVQWLREGFSECSKSCAEGRQTMLIKCINRDTKKTINDRYCHDLPRPKLVVRKCNRAPCPAYYDAGQWSECSRTCGVGRRSRRVVCRQQFPRNFTTVVSYKRCRKLEKPNTHELCQARKCARWVIKSDWSECSVQCGNGKQTREVICTSDEVTELPSGQCGGSRPPPTVKPCKNQPCITAWFNTDWSSCSADCDTGVQKRDVKCINSAGLAQGCSSQSKPEETRSCASASCGDKYEWFTGPWGPCSTDCGRGTQDRRVTCMLLRSDGEMSIADSRDLCSSEDQPATSQSCNTQACGSKWFYTSWSECSVSCGEGTRGRNVWCLDAEARASTTCKASEKPRSEERCNADDCNVLIDPQCKDLFRSCRMVLQARLCSYPYYKRNCCRTCSQDLARSPKTINYKAR